jgi:hypothetical protein
MTRTSVEGNERSPTLWASSERNAPPSLPLGPAATAQPRWRLLARGSGFAWFEHRARWSRPERPRSVGDGADPIKISNWRVPLSVSGRPVELQGDLWWLPDPEAYRARQSAVSSPLLSAAILAAAMVIGALVGVLLRRRLEPRAAGAG